MGIQARDYVWAKSRQTGGALLVMLAIAEHTPDGTDESFPSVDTLARYARLSVRQVQRILDNLENGDYPELIITRGQGRGHNSTYQIIGLRKGDISDRKGVNMSPFSAQEKVTFQTEKVTSAQIKGDISDRKGDIFSTPPRPPYKAEPIEPNTEPKKDSFAVAQESPPLPPAKPKQKSSDEIDIAAIDLPPCVSRDVWVDWVDYRRGKGKKISIFAARQQIKFLAESHARGQPADEIIAQSIRNDWQGLFELKNVPNGNGKKTPSQTITHNAFAQEFEELKQRKESLSAG